LAAAIKPISLQDFIIVNNVDIAQLFINNITNVQTINKLKKLYVESNEHQLMLALKDKEAYHIKRLYYYLVLYLELTNKINTDTIIKLKTKICSYMAVLNENKKYSKLSQEETQLINTALDYVLN